MSDPTVQRIVLLGSDIAHSRSPDLHNNLFNRYGLPYRYELMPLDAADVVRTIEMMKRGGYRGANITSPHKQVALPALDELSEEARAIGAVNTILFEGGRAIGYNTDAHGFARSLEGHALFEEPFTAAVIGTGGAAMAAIHALLGMPGLRDLVLYSRDAGRARSAVGRYPDPRIRAAALESFITADLLVHATPVGLAGRGGMVISSEQLAGTKLLYEMIYSPPATPLLAAAHALGIDAMNGDAMFTGQAMAAFRIWTGRGGGMNDEGWGMVGGK